MAVKRLTKRWLYNSFSVILIIILALVALFAFGIKSYYYNNVRQAILSQANYVDGLLVRYSEDSSTDFSTQMRKLVENFSEKQRIELMAIDADGGILLTSSGFEPDQRIQMPDYEDALQSSDRHGYFVGRLEDENIMAITLMSQVVDENLSGMRYVVSLTLVDRQVFILIMVISLTGVAILFFVIVSSSYFINSIINPVGKIGDTARRIAQGDLHARLTKANDDEIGELCDTINYMAEELAATEQLKNDFISSVSHELRTPLTAIKGWGETLQSNDDIAPETMNKGMHVILSETERLSTMVEELLDFSRMQSGRLSMSTQKLDILAELSDAVLMFTQRARQDNITLNYDEPEDFAVVEGDRNRLRQVFINIIDNALKYSDSGGSITITAGRRGQWFVVSVADTGIGIGPEDLPKVKTKFYKANSTRRGSGIGLAVADEIIRLHGGNLEIASTVGQGTVVTISLPLAEEG